MNFSRMTPEKFERQLEILESRRIAADERAMDRMERNERKAAPLIGELCRDGRTVFYIIDCKGKKREANFRGDLVEFLARNKYI